MKTNIFRINTTDVVLQDYEIGQGKIIISDDNFGYNFSYYWGSMGSDSTLSNFLLQISSDYFARKLCSSKYVFDSKKTFSLIRRSLKDELPWYKHTEFQKELRVQINEFEQEVETSEQFYGSMPNFLSSIDYYSYLNNFDRKVTKELIENIFSYTSDFICTNPSKEMEWLEGFHKKLKKYLTVSPIPQPTL